MNQKDQRTERRFDPEKWGEDAGRFQQALDGGDTSRLQLARSLAREMYDHPECLAANTRADQRSFCFEDGRITPKAVVLIHGFTACPYEMRELGQRLFELGINTVGVRLSGHGTSGADIGKYSGTDWKKDVQKGLAIASLLGHETMVIGESMGGALAAILTADFPELVQKLVLCAPCLQIANRFAPMAKLKLVQKFLPQNDMGVRYEWQRDYWYEFIPTTSVARLIEIAQEGRAAGGGITSPTLIIQAENDRVVNPKGAIRFFNTLTKIDPFAKKLRFFPNGHHNLTIDLNPQKNQVFQWIEEWI
jgi:carboxylesterase